MPVVDLLVVQVGERLYLAEVAPTRPTFWPSLTWSPLCTAREYRCAYRVRQPPPWPMTMVLP